MSNETIITLYAGGTEERNLPVSKITIPDLWHIAEAIRQHGRVADGPGCADLILECWQIAHGLKRHIQES